MVIKKTNKISQKDINLLLKKFIIIIRKISNSCGNKKKNITKGGGGPLDFFKNKKEEKELFNELNSFNDVEFNKSIKYFEGIADNIYENLKVSDFIKKDNINPYAKDNLQNTSFIQYNKGNDDFKSFIKDNSPLIKSNIGNDANGIYPFTSQKNFVLFYLDDNNNIKYVNCLIRPDTNIIKTAYSYLSLNIKIYDKLKNSDEYIFDTNDKNIIEKYIKVFYEGNIDKDKNTDSIISYLKYTKYIEELLKGNNTTLSNLFEIKKLKKFQEMGGKINYNILKHATIYNIGIVLKTLKDILVDQ